MPPTKQRILCVDNRASRNLAVLMLERAQYEVTTAGSMTQALKLARSEHFDLYLISHRLRGGSKLCGKLGEFDPRTPVLFYSSVTYPYHQKRAVGCETAGDPMMPVDIG